MPLNDVDLDAVTTLAGAIGADPNNAATTWSADVRWTGGFRSEAHIRDFGPLASDEPAGLGGTDLAPNPVEQLLAALGNCLAVGYAANASVAGIELEAVDIRISGDLDLHSFLGLRPGHAGFSSIRAEVFIRSDAAEDDLEALHRTVTGTSPVGHTLSSSIPLDIELAPASEAAA